MQYGTGNPSLLVGLDAVPDFHFRMGPQRVRGADIEEQLSERRPHASAFAMRSARSAPILPHSQQ